MGKMVTVERDDAGHACLIHCFLIFEPNRSEEPGAQLKSRVYSVRNADVRRVIFIKCYIKTMGPITHVYSVQSQEYSEGWP